MEGLQAKNSVAFKEWASVVEALAAGKQILILRKGGIREDSGAFEMEHDEFFLFPTYEHQNKADLKVEAHPDLEATLRAKPDSEQLSIGYYAKVVGVIQVTSEEALKRIRDYHVWSDEAVRKRFHFGSEKGIFAIVVRVFRLPKPHPIRVKPEYGGCKSWVQLDQALATGGAEAVLTDADFYPKWEAIKALFLESNRL